MNKRFSIIMPVYNVAAYLERSVTSVLAQSGDDFEILLVDDGSKDESGVLCDEWAEKHDCIQVIHKQNGGLASARNTGLDAATGEYVLMIDSDDYIDADTLDVIRSVIDTEPVDMVHYDYVIHHEEQLRENKTTLRPGLYSGSQVTDELLGKALLDPETYSLSACIHAYRRDFLNENALRFVSEKLILSEDFHFNLCALQCAQSVYLTDRIFYHYDMREGSLTHSSKPQMFERYTKLYTLVKEFYESRNAPEALMRKLNRYYVYFLFYRTIVSREFWVRPNHSWEDGRANVARMLQDSTLNACANDMDETGLPIKERLKVRFIKMRFEPGLALAFRDNKKG